MGVVLYVPNGLTVSAEQLPELGAIDLHLGLHLERSFYGFKQAGRLWHTLQHKTLISIGFCQCITDAFLYYKIDIEDKIAVGTCVNDLLVTDTTQERVREFFDAMVVLELKDLGRANKFLGVRINCDIAAQI